MNFRRGREREAPEINFIPLIDLLLVIVIFLVVTTTYHKVSDIKINLPEAAQTPSQGRAPEPITVAVDASGNYAINGRQVDFKSVENLGAALKNVATGQTDPMILINADVNATHQSVINIMEAARGVNFTRITFATQQKHPSK